MMETLKNTIFSFLGPDTFQIFIFEYSLTKKITITQEPQLLFPSSLDYIFSVSVPLGINERRILRVLGGVIKKKMFKNDLKQVKNIHKQLKMHIPGFYFTKTIEGLLKLRGDTY